MCVAKKQEPVASAGSDQQSHREGSGDHDWQLAHERLTALARSSAELDLDVGQWLLAALRTRAHEWLGYGSFTEYVERMFGYAPRLTLEKTRVAEMLEQLPLLTDELRVGAVSWSAVRELTRVAVPETEVEWCSAARGKTGREIERLVSGHRPGSRPDDPTAPNAGRHILRFDVSAEVLATFREAIAKLRGEAAGPLDDDSALLLMARHVLQGPNDEGRASYQVSLTVCDHCQRGWQRGSGEQIEVEPPAVAAARCDAQVVDATHVGCDRDQVSAERATQTIPPSIRRAVLQRDQHRCVFPGCRHATFVDLHHIELRSEGGRHHPDNLITVCSAHHRALHRGQVSVTGRVGAGLTFQHADGTSYGAVAVPTKIEVATQAFRALRALGFSERETRRALAEASRTHVGRSAAGLVRECLHALSHHALARSA